MADERSARPVSGEIMTGPDAGSDWGPAAEHAMRGLADDIIDVDYEVLPRFAAQPEPTPASARQAATPSLEGMDMLRKSDATPARAPASRGGPIFWIAGIGAVLAAFWISGGNALLRHAPFIAAVTETGAAFTISGVNSRVDASGPKPVLFIDGEAANDGARPSPLPPLEIHVTGNDGRLTRYTLGTSGNPLAPGERFAFSSRLDVPRNGVRMVSVTFAE